MMFKSSKEFQEGYFAAGDPMALMSPFHYLRMLYDTDYADGLEFACENKLLRYQIPVYVKKDNK